MRHVIAHTFRVLVPFLITASIAVAQTASQTVTDIPVKDLPHKYTDPEIICPGTMRAFWRGRHPEWVEWPPDKGFCERVTRDRVAAKKSYYVDDLGFCADYQNEVDCHSAAVYGEEKRKEEEAKRAEEARRRAKAEKPEEEEDVNDAINKAVNTAANSMSSRWENSVAGRAASLSQQIAQGIANARARNAPGLVQEYLQNALLLAQAASSKSDQASLGCAQEFLEGRPSSSCRAMSRQNGGSTRESSQVEGCNDSDVQRATQAMSSCGDVPESDSMCETYRAHAACMRKVVAAAGSCSAIANSARESEQSALQGARAACAK